MSQKYFIFADFMFFDGIWNDDRLRCFRQQGNSDDASFAVQPGDRKKLRTINGNGCQCFCDFGAKAVCRFFQQFSSVIQCCSWCYFCISGIEWPCLWELRRTEKSKTQAKEKEKRNDGKQYVSVFKNMVSFGN